MSSARWRRLALSGAAVGSAAASSAAMGAVVQVTQVGNEVTSLANNLRADLSGDGVSDLPGLQAYYGPFTRASGGSWGYRNKASAVFNPGGVSQFLGSARYFKGGSGNTAFKSTLSSGFRAKVGYTNTTADINPRDISGMYPITFTDPLVNGGAKTNALLEMRAFSTSKSSHTLRLLRLVFNDRSTAAPTGVGATPGSPAPEFSRAAAAARVAAIAGVKKKIEKLTKQLREAEASKKKAIAKKIKRAKAQLAAL